MSSRNASGLASRLDQSDLSRGWSEIDVDADRMERLAKLARMIERAERRLIGHPMMSRVEAVQSRLAMKA